MRWRSARDRAPPPSWAPPDLRLLTAALLVHFQDPSVDELLLNGACSVFVRSGTKLAPAAPFFEHDEALLDFLLELAASQDIRLDPACGSAGGTLPELPGRWHCVLPPLSRDGPLFCVRRHRFEALTLDDFSMTAEVRGRLERHVEVGAPLVIVGATGCGKTSLLAALLRVHALEERVVVIETLPELPRLGPAWIRLAERPASLEGRGGVAADRLLAEALRLSPDRLVLGEIRGAEARAFVEAARTGHQGLMATLHAGSANEALARLCALAKADAAPDGLAVVRLVRGRLPRIVGFTRC
jgi:pilus assembly protein CpaF